MTTPYLPSRNNKADVKKSDSKQDKVAQVKEALDLLQGIGLTGEDGKLDPIAAEFLKDAIEQASSPQSLTQKDENADSTQQNSETKKELKR